MSPDPSLTELAAAVADGSEIDWAAVEAGAESNELRQGVQSLRILAAIATVHRELSGLSDEELGTLSSAGAVGAAPEPDAPLAPDEDVPRTARPRWGHLVIVEKLGSGAFGDVFRAWDTALDREVALKVLRRSPPTGADSIMREGQLLARISHPNVMAVYGAQEQDGQVGIWGEFLEGRTLARLVRDEGPLSADETLIITESISRALAAVHRAGLLHRDVKAQNVMRERGGRIVLMDFGLGQALDEIDDRGAIDLAGTPMYLAPELFSGGRPSIRTDLYALGVLMFHLATGTYPIAGTRLGEIADAHRAGRRLALQDLRPELPTAFVQVVERALHPDPSERFESAGAMQAAIASAQRPMAPREAARRRVPPLVAGGLVVALLGSAAAGAYVALSGRPAQARPTPARLLALEPPAGTRFADSSRNMPAISPDGRRVAFSAADAVTGTVHLWIHSLEQARATMLAGSQGAMAPFWSPDSDAVGFFEPGGTIRRVTSDGVSLGSIDVGQEPRGATINRAGVLVYPRGPRSGLFAVDTTGDHAPRLVVPLDASRGELGLTWPHFLPDGEHFIYFVLSNDENVRGLHLGSLAKGAGRRLVGSDASGITAGDQLLYVKNGDLVRQRLLSGDQGVAGPPVPMALPVTVAFDWRSVVSGADDGTLVYLPADEDTELVWLDAAGALTGKLPVPAARYRSPALSRDGRLVAVQRYRDGLSEIQVFDAETGRALPALAHSADVQFPVWGPGRQLAYASGDTGRMEIYLKDFATDAPPRRLDLGGADPHDSDKMPTDWSPDGSRLVVVERGMDRRYNLWVIPISDPAAAVQLRPGEGAQYGGRVSPDGRSIVYVRRQRPLREGAPPERELWACDFPSGQNPWLVATGGIDPAWPSNASVSFLDRAGRLTLLPRSMTRPGLGPVVFATGVHTPEGSRNSYAWTPDGARLLVNRPVRPLDDRRVMIRFGGHDGPEALSRKE